MHDGVIVRVPVQQLSTALMADTKPLRTFRWYKGQPHYSGTYWSSTEGAHVIYESRLELSRLLLADFDAAVTRIFAQPLMIRAKVSLARALPTRLWVQVIEAAKSFVQQGH